MPAHRAPNSPSENGNKTRGRRTNRTRGKMGSCIIRDGHVPVDRHPCDDEADHGRHLGEHHGQPEPSGASVDPCESKLTCESSILDDLMGEENSNDKPARAVFESPGGEALKAAVYEQSTPQGVSIDQSRVGELVRLEHVEDQRGNQSSDGNERESSRACDEVCVRVGRGDAVDSIGKCMEQSEAEENSSGEPVENSAAVLHSAKEEDRRSDHRTDSEEGESYPVVAGITCTRHARGTRLKWWQLRY